MSKERQAKDDWTNVMIDLHTKEEKSEERMWKIGYGIEIKK